MRPQHDVVHVVSIPLEGSPFPEDVLDATERSRASRFVHDIHRRRFIAAHTAMRTVLGRFLGVAAAAIEFATGSHGKPHVVDGPVDVRFNLSHSGEQALLALALGRDVGVDIEQKRPIEVLELSRHVFSHAERAVLAGAPPEGRLELFYRCWTRKESFIKARGDGLSFPLDGFDVSLEPGGPQLLLGCSAAPEDAARWTITDVAAPDGYAAAVTVEGNGFRVARVDAEVFR